MVLSILAACGGGGGGGGSGSPSSPADAGPAVVVPGVSAASLSPSSAAPGVVVTVTGSGFGRVTNVAIGGLAADFNVVNDTQLTATVPTGVNTATATITLSGTGFSAQVPSTLALVIPTLASMSDTTVPVGGTITVTGAHLDMVSSFLVGLRELTPVSRSETEAVLRTPMAPVNGPLVMTVKGGSAFTSPYTLVTRAPLLATSLSTGAAVVGDTVTLVGTGLDAVTSVTFDNGAAATISSQANTFVSFVVPAAAGPAGDSTSSYTSAVTVTTPTGQATFGRLAIGPSLKVSYSGATTDGKTTTVTVTGSNLSLVSGGTVGGVAATVISRSDSAVTLSVAGNVSGAVVLSTAYQQAVAAGAVSMTPTGITTTLSELDFAQVLNKASTDATLRLTPLRPVLARAFLVTTKAGTPSPLVTLVVKNGGSTLGTLQMTGPATIPTAGDAYRAATTYNVTVPAAWVTQDVTFQVQVSGMSALSSPAAPQVGGAARMRIVMVPLTLGGVTATLPTTAQVHDQFARAYPLASDSIIVTARSPFAVTAASAVATQDSAGDVLAQVETLRSQEDPTAFYYGFVPTSVNTTTLGGIGYLGSASNPMASATSAIGNDSSKAIGGLDSLNLKTPAWAQVMLHEVGHNHSLGHAPCGNPAGIDASFPYAGGLLGTQALYASLYADDLTIGTIGSPVTPGGTMTDVMGYCSGIFFSDYNYAKVQMFAEARTAAGMAALGAPAGTAGAPAATQAAAPAPTGYLVISGSINANAATLLPALATSAKPTFDVSSNDSPHALRVTTDAGQVFTYPVLAHSVADSDSGSAFFSRTIPNPGSIASVEVLQAGAVMKSADAANASRVRALSVTPAQSAPRAATWSETGGMLHLAWNSVVEPFATVTHVTAAGARAVVALRLEGGDALVDVTSLPAGGTFELAFSSMTSARLLQVKR